MTEYTINKFLTLKLENGKTYIYINGKKFLQCKRLMINILEQNIPNYDEIDSIDEAVDTFKLSFWGNRIARPSRIQNETITPEQEFWGHCSNLQAWYEHNYDTRLLHSNLAFPLLKALVDAGDINVKKMLKTEILERLESGHPNVIKSILSAGLLNYFNEEERKQLLQQNFPIIIEIVERLSRNIPNIFPYIFKERLLEYLNPEARAQLEHLNYPILLDYILKVRVPPMFLNFFNNKLLKHLSLQEIKQLIQKSFSVILKDIEKIGKHQPNLFLYYFEERLIHLLNKEEMKNLVEQHYPIILNYIQGIMSLEQVIYLINTGFLGYLNPEDKTQLMRQNYLLIFKNIDLILRPEIADMWHYYPQIILYIFEERLFDYLNPTEKEQLIRQNFPILLICIQRITNERSSHSSIERRWQQRISDETLSYIYITVYNAIKDTELIDDWLKFRQENEAQPLTRFPAIDKLSLKIEIEEIDVPRQNRTKCKYCLKVLPPKSISILIKMKRVYCPYCGKINFSIDSIKKAIERINSIFKAQSIDNIRIPRKYLPEIFDNELIEISEEYGLPVLKPIVETEFMMSGITIKFSGNEVIFYKNNID